MKLNISLTVKRYYIPKLLSLVFISTFLVSDKADMHVLSISETAFVLR